MSYSPQYYHRSSSPSFQYPSDDDTNDYYDYYADAPAPPGNYTYGYVSDYSPLRSDHYESEGSGEAIEEGVQPESGRTSTTNWHAYTSVDSPILAVPEPAPDYARMSMLSETPPPSNASVHTYLNRFTKFCKKVGKMPWMSAERTTADYYPEKNIQRKKPKNLFEEDWYDRDAKEITTVSWKSRRYIEKRQGMHGGLHFEMVVGGGNGQGGDVVSPYLGSWESTKSPNSVTGVIEPFPFTSAPHEDARRFQR